MDRAYRMRQKRTLSDSALHSSGRVIAWLYGVAFGAFEEPLYRRSRRGFMHEIETEFAGLLIEYRGHLVPHEGEELPRAFDYVAVTIQFEEFRLRLIRGRGELEAQIASISAPHQWQDLSLIWRRIDPAHPIPSAVRPNELSRLASAIHERFEQIVEAAREL